MPGPDQINEQKLRDIKNLNQEDLEEIYAQYGTSKRQPTEWTGQMFPDVSLAAVALHATKAVEMMPAVPMVFGSGVLDKITDLEKDKIHYTNSNYEAKWMYPSIIGNAKLTHMEMLLHGMDFSDQIDSDHEQYSYFFNMHRDNVGLPRIELKVGSLYELQLGRKRDIIKSMTLVDIKGGLESNKIPELYFENDKTFYNESGHRTNISHIKIWKEIKGK